MKSCYSLNERVQRTSDYNQSVHCFKLEIEVYKTTTFLKRNPWNGHLPLGLFLAHTKIKQTSEYLSCADEPAAIDNGIFAVLNARQYHT